MNSCRLFLRSEIRSEFRGTSTKGEALQAPPLSRLDNCRSVLGIGVFALFPRPQKSAKVRPQSSAGPGRGAQLMASGGLCGVHWRSTRTGFGGGVGEPEAGEWCSGTRLGLPALAGFACGFLEFQQGRPVRGCAYIHPEASAHERYLASALSRLRDVVAASGPGGVRLAVDRRLARRASRRFCLLRGGRGRFTGTGPVDSVHQLHGLPLVPVMTDIDTL